MKRRRALLGTACLVLAAAGPAEAAHNAVPATRLGRVLAAITANTLKPAECAGITLTRVVTGSGSFSGTAANELILGGNVKDRISGGGGDDCILGGGGADDLTGGDGNDVCLGGPGNDDFKTCETADP